MTARAQNEGKWRSLKIAIEGRFRGGKTYHILGDFWAGACIVVQCGVVTTIIFFRHFSYGVMWWFVVYAHHAPQFILWCKVVYARHAPRFRSIFQEHLMWCQVVCISPPSGRPKAIFPKKQLPNLALKNLS